MKKTKFQKSRETVSFKYFLEFSKHGGGEGVFNLAIEKRRNDDDNDPDDDDDDYHYDDDV
jgi:hypothetical protein